MWISIASPPERTLSSGAEPLRIALGGDGVAVVVSLSQFTMQPRGRLQIACADNFRVHATALTASFTIEEPWIDNVLNSRLIVL